MSFTRDLKHWLRRGHIPQWVQYETMIFCDVCSISGGGRRSRVFVPLGMPV